jgi:cysteine desulfurase
MAVAARLAAAGLEATRRHLAELERIFLQTLEAEHLKIEINGARDDKIPGVLSLAIRGAAQDDLVIGMDLAGVAISAGAACSTGVIEPSPVLRAMNVPAWRLQGSVRISFGRSNTPDQARQAAQALAALSRRLVPQRMAEGSSA